MKVIFVICLILAAMSAVFGAEETKKAEKRGIFGSIGYGYGPYAVGYGPGYGYEHGHGHVVAPYVSHSYSNVASVHYPPAYYHPIGYDHHYDHYIH